MARPRYQLGSLFVRGKPRRYVIRWREDVVNADGTIDRIQHAETIGLVTRIKRQQALEILQSRVGTVRQQQRSPKVTMTLSEFVRTEWKPNAALALKKSSIRFHSPEHARLLLSVLAEPCASVVSIAVLTGMRIGEILALRWKRVDLLGATLEVAENYNSSTGEFGSPKTKKSRRVIPISSALVRVLENQRARSNSVNPEDLVFRTSRETPLNDKNLYNRELAPACDRIGLPRVSWHSFRHTHATLLHENGASLKIAQDLLGHEDPETTLKVYTHSVSDSQRKAVERVAGVLFSDVLSSAPAQVPSGRSN